METARKRIAVISGLIVASGFWMSDSSQPWDLKAFLGVMFGSLIAGSMIYRPDGFTRKHLTFCVAPALALLTIWTAVQHPARVLPTLVVVLAFFASQVAFVMSAPRDRGRGRPA